MPIPWEEANLRIVKREEFPGTGLYEIHAMDKDGWRWQPRLPVKHLETAYRHADGLENAAIPSITTIQKVPQGFIVWYRWRPWEYS